MQEFLFFIAALFEVSFANVKDERKSNDLSIELTRKFLDLETPELRTLDLFRETNHLCWCRKQNRLHRMVLCSVGSLQASSAVSQCTIRGVTVPEMSIFRPPHLSPLDRWSVRLLDKTLGLHSLTCNLVLRVTFTSQVTDGPITFENLMTIHRLLSWLKVCNSLACPWITKILTKGKKCNRGRKVRKLFGT